MSALFNQVLLSQCLEPAYSQQQTLPDTPWHQRISLQGQTGICDTCGSRASFGVEHGKPLHCGEHKHKGEWHVVSRQCGVDGCTTQASFGLEEGKARHCAQ